MSMTGDSEVNVVEAGDELAMLVPCRAVRCDTDERVLPDLSRLTTKGILCNRNVLTIYFRNSPEYAEVIEWTGANLTSDPFLMVARNDSRKLISDRLEQFVDVLLLLSR